MSYTIYKTTGVLLSSRDLGESGRMYRILTKDFGLIAVFAQGIRELASKLRGHLLPFSLVSVDCVRGKELWRLTNADTVFLPKLSPHERIFLSNISRVLFRLIHGEEKHEELFVDYEDALRILSEKELSREELKALESILLLRILSTLGYGTSDELWKPFLSIPLRELHLPSAIPFLRPARAEINRALQETHL